MTKIKVVVGPYHNNILVSDILANKVWRLPDGMAWSFGAPLCEVRLLETAIRLPPSRVTNINQYPLPQQKWGSGK